MPLGIQIDFWKKKPDSACVKRGKKGKGGNGQNPLSHYAPRGEEVGMKSPDGEYPQGRMPRQFYYSFQSNLSTPSGHPGNGGRFFAIAAGSLFSLTA